MKIAINISGEYNDVIIHYLIEDLIKYDDNSNEEVLFLGYNTSRDEKLKNKYSGYKKRVYLNWEAPCAFLSSNTCIDDQKYFTHIYSICPYTSEWLNNEMETKFISIPFPISLNTFKNIVWEKEKEFDVIYTGTLFNSSYYEIIDTIKKFKHIFTSLVDYPHPYNPTHMNVGCVDKWKLMSKSKINVGINQAHFQPTSTRYISNVKTYNGWEKNVAFAQIHSGIIPQFKSRITEAMGLKTLNLVKRDNWNVIENWFKPDVHFIYWDDKNDLNEKINYITNNYGQFKHIIDNAYEEVKKCDINYMYINNMLNEI